ncbi:MAG: response regulator [Ruminococcus sp.]|jgi:signal transduction histidine kinase/CheY-like chemotaxis protein|nr:response regulator [Ruminococcus sp.]
MKKYKFTDTFIPSFLLILSVAGVVTLTLIIGSVTSRMNELVVSEMRGRIEATAYAGAAMISSEELDTIVSEADLERTEIKDFRRSLINFAVESEVLYVYYIRIHDDGRHEFIIDNDTNPETAVHPGMDFTEDAASIEAEETGRAASSPDGTFADVDFDAMSDYFEYTESIDMTSFLSAYAPIYNQYGEMTYLVGVDAPRANVYSLQQSMRNIQIINMIIIAAEIALGVVVILLFRRKAIQSEAASQAKSVFLSSMGHEIRTPLNVIIGLTDIAMRSKDSEKKDDALKKIYWSGKHLLAMLGDILDMSRIESGKMELQMLSFSLDEMINNTIETFGQSAKDKNITLTYNASGKLPPIIFSDRVRMTQVLVNLISNAVKFTPEGGTVVVSTKLISIDEGKLRLQIVVKDSGIGISEKDRERIFKPFEQADYGTTRRYGGVGLGLAISQNIARAMDGAITLSTEEGEGSEFVFEALVGIGSRGLASTITLEEPELKINGTVLIADDFDINREIAGTMLESTNATIIYAEDGQKAVDEYKAHFASIKLILMDVQMPKIDGLEATRQIRASGLEGCKTVPIIAMTANAFDEDVKLCKEAGMDAHLPKPFDIGNLFDKVERELARVKETEGE